MSSFRLADIFVEGQRQQVGRIEDMADDSENLDEVTLAEATSSVTQRVLSLYASEEEAATIKGQVVERVVNGRNEKPLLPGRRA